MRNRRTAFTMLELLAVAAIVGVLALLTAVAAFHAIGHQQGNDTRVEIAKLRPLLTDAWRTRTDYYAGEWKTASYSANLAPTYNAAVAEAGGDPVRQRVIFIKLRQKQDFPQTFAEGFASPDAAFGAALTAAGYTPANASPGPSWQSSAMLLMVLERRGVRADDLGASSCLHDLGPTPSGRTLRGLVDGWGNPLAFCRWPTGSAVLNPTGPTPRQSGSDGGNDPADPSLTLEQAAWQTSPAGAWFVVNLHALGAPPTAGADATSYRLQPLIASAGPDGVLGLDPITFAPVGAAQAADDLWSYP